MNLLSALMEILIEEIAETYTRTMSAWISHPPPEDIVQPIEPSAKHLRSWSIGEMSMLAISLIWIAGFILGGVVADQYFDS